jgi:hypothetical protein
MSTARIAPGLSSFDVRTFECAARQHIHAKADPMKSAAVNWLVSHDLRPPN